VPPAHPLNMKVEVLCDGGQSALWRAWRRTGIRASERRDAEMVEQLDAGLAPWRDSCKTKLVGRAHLPGQARRGTGRGGSCGLPGRRLVSGIDAVMLQTRLPEAASVRLGDYREGCFDEQSLRGKVVSGVLRVARCGRRQDRCSGRAGPPGAAHVQASRHRGGDTLHGPWHEADYAITHSELLLDRPHADWHEAHLREGESLASEASGPRTKGGPPWSWVPYRFVAAGCGLAGLSAKTSWLVVRLLDPARFFESFWPGARHIMGMVSRDAASGIEIVRKPRRSC